MNRLVSIFVVAVLLSLLGATSAYAKGLRRVDMVVSGSSCASCLIRIEKKLKATPGVLKAMISVYRPYSAVVIYDSAKTSISSINKILAEEKAGSEQVVDISIKAVPALLMPASK